MIITVDMSRPVQRKKKEKKPNKMPVHHFQVTYVHNPVKLFWLLTLIMCFNVGNNFNHQRICLNSFHDLKCII